MTLGQNYDGSKNVLRLPSFIFDGECEFCKFWIRRWKHVTDQKVQYIPYQSVGEQLPPFTKKDYEAAVHFVEPGQNVTRGAEAVFRCLSYAQGMGWIKKAIYQIPGLLSVAQWFYFLIANNRGVASRITFFIYGGDDTDL